MTDDLQPFRPLPDDSIKAMISAVANEFHNISCERHNDEALSMHIADLVGRLWGIMDAIDEEITRP